MRSSGVENLASRASCDVVASGEVVALVTLRAEIHVASSEDDVEDFHVLRRAQAGPLHWVDCTALRQLVALMLWSAVRSPHFAGCSAPGTVVVCCTVATSGASGSVRHDRFCHGV